MKTKIENSKIELIAWLNDECPKVWPPLEPYTTADLSHDFAEKLRERLDNIIILKGNSIKEPTAMEMIKEVFEPIQLGEIEVCLCSYHRPNCDCNGICRNCGKRINLYQTAKSELASKKAGKEKKDYSACDVCGRHPGTIIINEFGTFCKEHVKHS